MKLVKTILNQYSKELEEAVKTLDVYEFRKFYAKWYLKGMYNMPLPANDPLVKISICKMACHLNNMPPEVKENARMILKSYGMSEEIY